MCGLGCRKQWNLNIREHYTKDGSLAPGPKSITLPIEVRTNAAASYGSGNQVDLP